MDSTWSRISVNNITLDKGTPINLYYLAEGAANVVFKISSKRSISTVDKDSGKHGTSTDGNILRFDRRLEGKLLRLRKDLPSIAPVIESHRHFEEQIEPLFPPGSLVEQLPCKTSTDFLKKANDQLREIEADGLRPNKRHGVYLAEDEPYAMAVTSMLADFKHASCEFKPKWLTQSPSAPHRSKRCRTCALRAMRQIKDHRPPQSGDFCPLTLLGDDEEVLSSTLNSILSGSRGAAPLVVPDLVRQLRPYFQGNRLIRLLHDLQLQKDPHGILKADPSDLDFMTAMTLRDCTMFLKVSDGRLRRRGTG